jgi:hypothetical protein
MKKTPDNNIHNVEQNVMVCNWCIEANGPKKLYINIFFCYSKFAPVLYFKKAMTTVFWSDKMFRINDDC